MRFCVDVLGAAKYPDVVFKNVPKNIGLGVFALEFGDASGFVKSALSKGYEFIRIQMLWSHNNHTYGDKDLPALNKLARLYNNIAIANPQAKVQLSPFCEHLLYNPDKYCDYVAKLAPNCEVINSPVKIGAKRGAFSKKYKNECHGSNPRPNSGSFNFSYDGSDAFNSDVEGVKANMSSAENFFVWGPPFNLHRDENDKTRNSPPTSEYMKAALYLFNTRGKCSLPKDALWKPMSEKWKPCLITPKKASKIELKRAGKLIATMPYYGTYVDGRHRYYTSTQGYKIGQVEVWIDGKLYGKVDAGFRVNAYR